MGVFMAEEFKSIDIATGRHAIELARQEWGGLQDITHGLKSLMADPENICKSAGQWYVVSIEHQQEDLAKHEVACRGMVAYLPVAPKRERHGRGSHRTAWRPLLGLYMFVRCMPAQWGLVTAARGVRRFLGVNGSPQAIDDGHIEVIRLVEAEKAEAERDREALEDAAARARANGRSGIIWQFSQGDRVRIKTGPFAGLYAQLTAAVDVHDRIKALVSILGGPSPIELSAFDVEKAV
jgi:transcription antitermination factor NusG